MFKKRSKANNSSTGVRKRIKGNDSSSEDETQVVRTKKSSIPGGAIIQRTNKKCNFDKSTKDESSSSEDDGIIKSSYRSSRTDGREGPGDMGATSYIQHDTERDKDAQAIFERSQDIHKETKGKADDKIYRGINNYSHFYEKKDSVQGNASAGGVRKGPIRAPEHLRATVRWDYQPDLCKDFKETGFCGFGDSCKFLHDRTDYKLGWQLELEHSRKTSGFHDDSDENYEIPSDEEHLPFKCLFCRQSFVDPVVTKCRHFYCEKCAIEQFQKTMRCFVCGENTKGLFTPATELIARLEQGDDTD